MNTIFQKIRLLVGITGGVLMQSNAFAMDPDIGTDAGTCQYHNAVRLNNCTGVYMGNRLVLTAAHCIDNITEGTSTVRFGETDGFDAPYQLVIDYCKRHPDGEYTNGVFGQDLYDGVDLAYCVLEEDQYIPPSIPIVPPMLPEGCERDWLVHKVYEGGTDPIMTAVGSGCSVHHTYVGQNCMDGVKRFSAQQLAGQTYYNGSATKLEFHRDLWGGEDSGIRNGDSGGPLMVRLPSGAWRVIGVIHGTSIADTLYVEAVPPYLHWIEADSGIDITPCHYFSNGQWHKSNSCDSWYSPSNIHEERSSWTHQCQADLVGSSWDFIDGGFCGDWPASIDDYVSDTNRSEGATVSNFFYSHSFTYLNSEPTRTSSESLGAVREQIEMLSVFPFLVPSLEVLTLMQELNLPGEEPTELLTLDEALESVDEMLADEELGECSGDGCLTTMEQPEEERIKKRKKRKKGKKKRRRRRRARRN